MVDSTGKSAAMTAVVMTATFVEEEVVVDAAGDDDNGPTTVLSAAFAEVAPACLFVAVVEPPFPTLRLPPVDGFNPSIQTRC